MTTQYNDSVINEAVERALLNHNKRVAASNTTAAHPFTPFPQGTIGRDASQCQLCVRPSKRSDSAAATARPWCVQQPRLTQDLVICGTDWKTICRLRANPIDEANAAIIVQAVNERETLLRALRIAKDMIDELGGQHYYEGEHVKSACSLCDIEAALTLAEGKGA